MPSDHYVVAWRRESRRHAPSDWVQQIGAIEGVSVVGATDRRAQVAADEAGIARIRESFGPGMLIEPVIEHRTQEG